MAADNSNTEVAEVNKTAEEVPDRVIKESEKTKIEGININFKFPLFSLK